MCRNIRPLFNLEPPATAEEIDAAALQFVRKISGFAHPAQANQAAFAAAAAEIAQIAGRLIGSLESSAAPKNRQEMAARAQARSAARFGKTQPSGSALPADLQPA
ncbi:MAG: DUF2277 domain-containing protein [Chloroflexota bacterium]|nr:DUF2277 domain-containing protein [Chloroflexota bacterium]